MHTNDYCRTLNLILSSTFNEAAFDGATATRFLAPQKGQELTTRVPNP